MAAETVLVVEDNETNMKLLLFILKSRGYEVLSATNADEALAALKTALPRLILMDLQLPGIDGLALTRKLKADPRTEPIPVIAVTAFAMKGDKEKALDAGCADYLTKPIHRLDLIRMLDEYMVKPSAVG